MSDGTGILTKPMMFLSSYAPLLTILTIRFDGSLLRFICAMLALLGAIGLFVLMRLQHEDPQHQGKHELAEVRHAGEGASSYLVGYLLPFLTVSEPTMNDLIAYGAFFIVAYFVTTRTGIIQVNPLLFLFRYNIHSIIEVNGHQRYLISKTKETINSGSTVMASRMTNDILIFEGIAAESEK